MYDPLFTRIMEYFVRNAFNVSVGAYVTHTNAD